MPRVPRPAYKTAVPILDRFSARGLIHRNKAARHKSRINARIKALKAPQAA
jgi:small subunit ribosomal protein S20